MHCQLPALASKKFNFNYHFFLNYPQTLQPQPIEARDFTQRL